MIDPASPLRIAVAAAVSVAVHAAVIQLGHIKIPADPAPPLPLAVRIESVKPVEAAPRRVPPQRIARAPRALTAPAAIPSHAAPATLDAIESGASESAVAVTESAAVEAAAPAPPATEPIVVAKAEPSTFSTNPPQLRTLPRRGQITYNLVYGRDRFPVGRTIQTWQFDGTSYRIASASETTGIIDLFRSQHRNYMSRGTLTRDGLKPESFLMSRNRGRGVEEARVQFDWAGGALTLGPATEPRREALPDGTQDLVSFIYQLALNPPAAGRMRVPVTNGNKLEVHELEVLPEESIDTPLGVMRALPLRQVRKAGEESIDVWLAAEYRYLPVRVRFFDREGQPAGEQIVREIRLSDD